MLSLCLVFQILSFRWQMMIFFLCYELIKSWWVFSSFKSMKCPCELGLLKSRSKSLCCGHGLEPWGQQFLVAYVSALTNFHICLVWSHFDSHNDFKKKIYPLPVGKFWCLSLVNCTNVHLQWNHLVTNCFVSVTWNRTDSAYRKLEAGGGIKIMHIKFNMLFCFLWNKYIKWNNLKYKVYYYNKYTYLKKFTWMRKFGSSWEIQLKRLKQWW